MRNLRWLVALSMLTAMPLCHAASFDCSRASSATERLVCGTPEISRLDDELATKYVQALQILDSANKAILQTEQRHWIRYVRDICTDTRCLASVYQRRITLLGEQQKQIVNDSQCSIPEGKSCRSVITYRDTGYRVSSFNRSLQRSREAGKVIGCDQLIDLPVGFRGSNHSFGGYCTIEDDGKRRRVKICDDDMIGNFAVEPATSDSPGELEAFTEAKCYGG